MHMYHFTIIMGYSIREFRQGTRMVGDKLPKPEHLRLCKMVDNVQCCYSFCERLVVLKFWAVHQAVKSITYQLYVCVCVCVCVCVRTSG